MPWPNGKHTTVTPGAAEKLGHALCVARVTGDLALSHVCCGASIQTTVNGRRLSVCGGPMGGLINGTLWPSKGEYVVSHAAVVVGGKDGLGQRGVLSEYTSGGRVDQQASWYL